MLGSLRRNFGATFGGASVDHGSLLEFDWMAAGVGWECEGPLCHLPIQMPKWEATALCS